MVHREKGRKVGEARPSICLTMIVKNEAIVIERCLRSVRPFIDCWSIVDTGSTDGTQDLVRRLLFDLPGELHERPWRDFGHNRTEALELARSRGGYLFVIDADETFQVEEGFELPLLSVDGYYTQHRGSTSSVSFARLQFLRAETPWRYEGVLHEAAVCDQPHQKSHIDGPLCVGHFDGARNQGAVEEKYKRDAEILEKALESEPHNARYRYYLARSYRDAGQLGLALENFQKRAKMGGWDEEVWHSLHLAAVLLAERNQHDAAVATHLRAYQLRPERAESLCALARLHRLREEHHLAYLYANQAVRIPRPNDRLFVDDSVYAWRAMDELCVAAYWTGEYQQSLDLAARLLEGEALPEQARKRIDKNRVFAQEKLKSPGAPPRAQVRLSSLPKPGHQPDKAARLRELVPLDRPIRILDVGASAIDGDPPYQSLLDAGGVELVSFEPSPAALAQLREQAKSSETILGEALGDGKRHTLRFCRAPGMNSLLEPDPSVLQRFNLFGDFGTVIETKEVPTFRLDDLDEVGVVDFVKLDVQGFEKTIIEHGRKRISQALIVHTEAAFVPMYRQQPCFGELDVLLRERGFVTHTIFSAKRWGVAPLVVNGQPRRGFNQLLDGDFVYLRSFFDLSKWDDGSLARAVHILHFVYGSFDVAYYLIDELARRKVVESSAPEQYLELAGVSGSAG